MFLTLFIDKLISKKKGGPKRDKIDKKKKSKHDVISIESLKLELIKNGRIHLFNLDEFTIYSFIEGKPIHIIDDYVISENFIERKTTATSIFNFSNSFGTGSEKIGLDVKISPSDFLILDEIKKSKFGDLLKVQCKLDGNVYALKCLKKSKLKEDIQLQLIKSERKILEHNHPFIVTLKRTFSSDKKLYFLMDYYSGGDLATLIYKKGKFDEITAKFYLAQLVLVLCYLHKNNIIHRDLSLENVVLDSNGYIKLTNFGLAKDNITDDWGCTQTYCGTCEYLAPEMLSGYMYGKAIDIWCLGVSAFRMFFGKYPFYDNNTKILLQKIHFNNPDNWETASKDISIDAKNLLEGLLDKNQKTRLKISQIKLHRFFDGIDFDELLKMNVTPPVTHEIKTFSELTEDIPDSEAYRILPDSKANNSYIIHKDFPDFTYAQPNFFNK